MLFAYQLSLPRALSALWAASSHTHFASPISTTVPQQSRCLDNVYENKQKKQQNKRRNCKINFYSSFFLISISLHIAPVIMKITPIISWGLGKDIKTSEERIIADAGSM